MADWFIGSASKALDATATHWVHAIGFRSESALMALVVCDIDTVSGIDRQSIGAHINLHPIEAVDVILVASGVTGSLAFATLDASARHTVVHRVVDSIIDALTFGCPAVMRVTPHAIQWRKFDEHPIATLTRHTAPFDAQLRRELTQTCGDPTMCTTSAVPLASHTIVADLHTTPAHPVARVSWQQHTGGWVLTINDTRIVITAGVLDPAPSTHTWMCGIDPHTRQSYTSATALWDEAHP